MLQTAPSIHPRESEVMGLGQEQLRRTAPPSITPGMKGNGGGPYPIPAGLIRGGGGAGETRWIVPGSGGLLVLRVTAAC